MILTFKDVHLGNTDIESDSFDSFICDVDGTIADLTHRRKWILDKPKNWKAFEKNMIADEPIWEWIEQVKFLVSLGKTVIFCSGRGEQDKGVTRAWLWNVGLNNTRQLYMRREKDYRDDGIVKSELLNKILADGFDPKLVFDDRDRVVKMWRERGLTCVQVAEGDF